MPTSTDVEPRLKVWIVCACGCGLEGRPRTKAWQDGMHTRNCVCRRCTSGAHAKTEKRRVGKFARRSGLSQASGSGRRLGWDLTGICVVEETSAVAIVAGLRKWWESVGVERKTRVIRGQNMRPWAFVASWDDKPQLVVMSAEGFAELCAAACSPDDLGTKR